MNRSMWLTKTALIDGSKVQTYVRLNARANRLANALRILAVQRGYSYGLHRRYKGETIHPGL